MGCGWIVLVSAAPFVLVMGGFDSSEDTTTDFGGGERDFVGVGGCAAGVTAAGFGDSMSGFSASLSGSVGTTNSLSSPYKSMKIRSEYIIA